MKQLILACLLFYSFGVGNAFADFLGIGRFWEDVKRETTKAAHNTEKTIGKAWEDTNRESTNFAKSDVGKVVGVTTVVGAAVAVGDYGRALEIIKELAKVY